VGAQVAVNATKDGTEAHRALVRFSPACAVPPMADSQDNDLMSVDVEDDAHFGNSEAVVTELVAGHPAGMAKGILGVASQRAANALPQVCRGEPRHGAGPGE